MWTLGHHTTAELGESFHPLYTELVALVGSLIDVALPFLYIIYNTNEQPEITTPTTPCMIRLRYQKTCCRLGCGYHNIMMLCMCVCDRYVPGVLNRNKQTFGFYYFCQGCRSCFPRSLPFIFNCGYTMFGVCPW